jgi:hypothetical protein
MNMGWVVTVVSSTNPSAQAVERGLEIAYSLRDEEWGSGASWFASRVGRSSTLSLIARAESLRPSEHGTGRNPSLVGVRGSARRRTSYRQLRSTVSV